MSELKFYDNDNLVIGGGDWELAPFKFSKILKIGGGTSPSYIDIIISGTTSVTLTSAIGLNYVKLFGGCEQNGTPTPDAPIDIVSNNGVLEYRDTELPKGYKRLKDIIFDGEVYYITDTYLTGADTTTLTINATENTRNVLGCYTGSSSGNNISFYLSTGNSGCYVRYKDSLYRPVINLGRLGQDYTISITPTGTTGFDTDVTWTELEFTCPDKLYIGWLANATSPKFMGAFKGNITVSSRAKFIPCERQSDNEIGYYDLNSNTFYDNQGTGTPTTSGYDNTHNIIYTDGTVETVALNLIEEKHENWGVNSSGVVVTTGGVWGHIAKVEPNKTYYYKQIDGNVVIGFFTSKPELGSVTYNQSRTVTNLGYFTTPNDNSIKYVLLRTAQDSYIYNQSATAEMLLKVGDYQDVQSVLDGEVTRQLGVKVLNGTEEGWAKANNSFGNSSLFADKKVEKSTVFCSHFQYNTGSTTNIPDMCIGCASTTINVYFRYDALSTVEQFQQWLATQYNAGTPVIVVYPLATATTESVTGQHLTVQNGTNIVEITQASIDGLPLEVSYKQQQ